MSATEINKIAGAVIGAFLVYLLLNFASHQIYGTSPGGHHGDEALAFAVEIESDSDEAEAEEVDFAAIFAAADVAAGEKVFKKCAACHAGEEGVNKVGPSLYRVVGRDIGSVAGFNYSAGLTDAEGNWDPQKIYAFLENPKAFGSAMSVNYKKSADRANVIAYLNEVGGAPVPLE
jgi:cytochrome c